MAWPDNVPQINNAQFQNDANTVTGVGGARDELGKAGGLIDKLNQALDSIGEGETPWTDGNDAGLMKTLPSGLNNDIGLLDANGNPTRSGKTIASSLSDSQLNVPTGAAVFAAVQGAGGLQVLDVTGDHIIFAAPGTTTVGLMVQWGLASAATAASFITFITEFSVTPYCVMGTVYDTAGTTQDGLTVESRTSQGVTFNVPSTPDGVYWLAIGNVPIPW